MALRDLLRRSTRDEHAALESLLALDAPALPLAAYQEYLRGMHAFHARVEPLLRAPALAALGVDMGARAKRAWLEEDLRWFGLAPLDDAPRVPAMADASRALGCAYVLEGATLGGHVLQARLAPRFGLGPGRGATFLAGYGERTGEMWRAFLAVLEQAPERGVDEAACVDAARATFASLGEWFGRRSPQPQ